MCLSLSKIIVAYVSVSNGGSLGTIQPRAKPHCMLYQALATEP